MVDAEAAEEMAAAIRAKVAPMVTDYLVVEMAVLLVGMVVVSAVLWDREVARWVVEEVVMVERETVGNCRCTTELAARTEL